MMRQLAAVIAATAFYMAGDVPAAARQPLVLPPEPSLGPDISDAATGANQPYPSTTQIDGVGQAPQLAPRELPRAPTRRLPVQQPRSEPITIPPPTATGDGDSGGSANEPAPTGTGLDTSSTDEAPRRPFPPPAPPAPEELPQPVDIPYETCHPPPCDNGWYCSDIFNCYPCCPRWSAAVGVIALRRDDPYPQPLLIGGTPGPVGGVDEFSADQFDLDRHGGPLIDLALHAPSGNEFQIRFFSVDDWDSQINLDQSDGNLLVDRFSQLAIANGSFRYVSALYSTEFNMRRRWPSQWIMPLIGFRWIELQEQYRVVGDDNVDEPTLVDRFTLDYSTHNHCYGFQLGAEGLLWSQSEQFFVDGMAKCGLFYNEPDVDARFAQAGVAPDPDRVTSVSEETTAAMILGELAIGATWRPRPWVTARGGYHALWLTGVALAPEQIDNVALGSRSQTTVNEDGSAFYHGPYAMLEFTW